MKLVLAYLLVFSFAVSAKVTLVENPKIKFTGYKFSNKVGVSGTFKKVDWKVEESAENFKKLIENASLKIDSYSLDAGNEARNFNITESLLKNWGGRYIDVKFKEVNETHHVVKAELTIGEAKKDLYFQYTDTGKGNYVFTATMDLLQMGFMDAFSKLSELCGPLHTGEDGVMKSWSVVDIEVVANINKK